MSIDDFLFEAIASADNNAELQVVLSIDDFVTNKINALTFQSATDVETTDLESILGEAQEIFGDDMDKLPQILSDIDHRAGEYRSDLVACMSDLDNTSVTREHIILGRRQRFLQRLIEIHPFEKEESGTEVVGMGVEARKGEALLALTDLEGLRSDRYDPARLDEDFVPTDQIPLRLR